MGAQNLDFAVICSKMGDFQPHIVYFWTKIFQQKTFVRQAKI